MIGVLNGTGNRRVSECAKRRDSDKMIDLLSVGPLLYIPSRNTEKGDTVVVVVVSCCDCCFGIFSVVAFTENVTLQQLSVCTWYLVPQNDLMAFTGIRKGVATKSCRLLFLGSLVPDVRTADCYLQQVPFLPFDACSSCVVTLDPVGSCFSTY